MKSIFLSFFVLAFFAVRSQKLPVISTQDLETEIFLGYDTLGASYSITDNVLIKKMDGQKWQYKNLQLGKITKVDLQNPLKIVIFYQDFNTVILVDNQLNETSNINLNDSTNPIIPMAFGLASRNRLWIYNNLTLKIGLYDFKTRALIDLTVPFTNNVKYYCSDFNNFRWVDELGNAYGCDVYGKVKSFGKLPEFEQMEWISDANVLYSYQNKLYQFNLVDRKSNLLEIDEKTFINFSCKDQILSIFTGRRITNYKIAIQ